MVRSTTKDSRIKWITVLLFLMIENPPAFSAENPIALASQLNISLYDLDGTVHSLRADGNTKAWVFVFISTECPIARSYIPTLNKLADECAKDKLDATYFGVISDSSVTQGDAKTFANEFAIKFPVLFDSSGKLANIMRPTNVPESFVLDRQQQLVYRGRIDDVYAEVGKRRLEATKHELRNAISAVVVGKMPLVSCTQPIGCPFESWKE